MKPVFKAKDGTEYPTQAGAEKREELIAAVKVFDDALQKLQFRMMENALTADGEPFETGKDYWYIVDGWGTVPRLCTVWMYPWTLKAEIEDLEETVTVREFRTDSRRGSDYTSYKINELYRDKKKAVEALHARCDYRLTQMAEEIRKMKEERQ